MKSTEILIKPNEEVKKRIAAYCRVSTDSMDQKNSFITQIKYYSNYVKTHPQYELVDIYADKSTPRLIQFYTFKNAVKPPFLGGFFVFGASAA